MPGIRILPLTLLSTVLLAGCAIGRRAENEPLDAARIAELEPGVTTAREVVELLGAPVDVVQLGRRSAYQYRHKREAITGVVLVVFNMFNQDQRSDLLWVFFDEDGLLTHYGATLQADRTRVATPFKDVYVEEAPEAAAPAEAKAETPAEAPTEAPTEAPAEVPAEVPAETPPEAAAPAEGTS